MPYRYTCGLCGAPFTARTRTARYCRPLCRMRAFNAARKADGRQAQQRTKLTQYNKQYRTNYYQQSIQVVPCTACSAPITRGYNTRYRQPACSPRCKQYLRNGTWPSTPIPDRHPVRSTPVPPGHPSRAATCNRCHTGYHIQYPGQRYCTPRCKQAAHWTRRELAKRGELGPDISPQYIYERDHWRCQLCRRKVHKGKAVPHPMAPTLDHIVPLSKGGKHEIANIFTAHFICNARKGNRNHGEQLMLFG
jgi:5-methylcytosine-specific restriction endonuclease McrA